MSLTKSDISNKIIEEFSLNRNDADTLLNNLFELIKQGLAESGNIKITNFGKFVTKEKSARIGRNPKTKQEHEISARKVALFRPSGTLKEAVITKN